MMAPVMGDGTATRIGVLVIVAGMVIGCGRRGFEASERDGGGGGSDGGAFDGGPVGDASAACLAGCEGGVCQGDTCVFPCSDGCPDPVVCPPGLPCAVDCVLLGSCSGGVDCAGATTCTVQCSGRESCAGAVSCGDAQVCDVDCISRGTCAGGVDCATSDCDVACTGQDSCVPGVECGDACACDVVCNTAGACEGGTVCPGGCDDGLGCSSALDGCDACE